MWRLQWEGSLCKPGMEILAEVEEEDQNPTCGRNLLLYLEVEKFMVQNVNIVESALVEKVQEEQAICADI
uniref:Uncharacterized protein n=1 Tax=Arundo donax TaxID=35708 RepID=A0A0A9BGG1_ARUDO